MNDPLERNSSISSDKEVSEPSTFRGIRLPNKFLSKSKKRMKRNGPKIAKLHKKKFKSRMKGGSIMDSRRKFNTPKLLSAPSIPNASSVSPSAETRFEPKPIK